MVQAVQVLVHLVEKKEIMVLTVLPEPQHHLAATYLRRAVQAARAAQVVQAAQVLTRSYQAAEAGVEAAPLGTKLACLYNPVAL